MPSPALTLDALVQLTSPISRGLGSPPPRHVDQPSPPPYLRYADERQADLDNKALELRKRQEAVPGLLNPHVRQDDMDM